MPENRDRPIESQLLSDALARRSLRTQGAFLLGDLRPGLVVLDCGCGPGSITSDLAHMVAPGNVIGVDIDAAKVERASAVAANEDVRNLSFKTASVYELPFADNTFDVAFAHALFQHLREPSRAIAEICRVVVPGGLIALRSPDWGGLLLAPRGPELTRAWDAFIQVYYAEGDAFAGSNGSQLLREAGCVDIRFTTTMQQEHPAHLAIFASSKLTSEKHASHVECLLQWGKLPSALFAQAWGEVVGRVPTMSLSPTAGQRRGAYADDRWLRPRP